MRGILHLIRRDHGAEIANRKNGGVPIQPFQISELNEQAAPFGFTFEEYL